jgi:predicted O-methyltransferase YrrM
MPLQINSDTAKTLEAIGTIPRVTLPCGIPDDAHNRVGGLINLIIENFPPDSVIMELGSGMGVSTEVFALLCKKVHTTDLWVPGLEKWREAFNGVFKRYHNISQYYRDTTISAHLFENNFFDAVYIDADHTYESVSREIKTWLPKVKIGGFICGHDYIERPGFNFGVIKAVNEILGTPDKVYEDTSWIIRKREGEIYGLYN